MAVTAAQLVVRVSGDATSAKQDLSDVNDKVQQSGGFFKNALSSALGFAAGAGAIGIVNTAFGYLKDTLVTGVTDALNFQQVQAQTAQALKSTGDASGMTAKSIQALADSLSQTTTFSHATIQTAENLLLTFTNIGKQTFPQATQAIMDVSQAMHENLQTAAIQVGKALDDPAKGMAALQRIGVTFTASQVAAVKAMMKTGDVAGAQKIILGELGKEFGGSAKAAGTTFAGQLAILNNRMDDAKEKIGQALLPILAQLMGAVLPLAAVIESRLTGGIQTLTGFITSQVMPAVSNLVTLFTSNLQPALTVISNILSQNWQPVLAGVAAVIVAALIPAIGGAATAIGGMMVAAAPLVALALAVAGIAFAFKYAYDNVKPFHDAVDQLGTRAKVLAGVFEQNIQPVLAKLTPVIQQLAQWIGTQLVGAFNAMLPRITSASNTFSKFLTEVAQRIGPMIAGLEKIGSFLGSVLGPIWARFWPGLQQTFKGVWDMISGIMQIAWSLVSGIILTGMDLLSGNWSGAWNDIKKMFAGVWNGIVTLFGGVWEVIQGVLKMALSVVAAAWSAAWNGISNFFKGLWNDIVGFFQGIWNGIVVFLRGAFTTIHDDAVGLFTNIRDTIQQRIAEAQLIIQTVINTITGFLKNAWNTIHTDVTNAWNSFVGVINGVESAITGAIQQHVITPIEAPVKGLISDFTNIGGQIMQGLINGVKNMAGNVAKAATDAANGAVNAAKNALGIHSPSTVFTDIGQNVSQGMINGVQSVDVAQQVTQHLAKAVTGLKASLGVDVSGSSSGNLAGIAGTAVGQAAAAQLGARGNASGANGSWPTSTLVLNIDGRQVAKAIIPYTPGLVRKAVGLRNT